LASSPTAQTKRHTLMSVMFSLRYVRRRQRHLRYRSMQRLSIVSMTSEKYSVCESSAELCLLHIVVSCVRWPVPHSFAKCHAVCQHVKMSTCRLVRQSFDRTFHDVSYIFHTVQCAVWGANVPSVASLARGVTMVTVVLRRCYHGYRCVTVRMAFL